MVNPAMVNYVHRRVRVIPQGEAKGQSIADFRPKPKVEPVETIERIGMKLDYQAFVQDFMTIMTQSGENIME
jgi:purine nucleosidase